MRSKYSRVPRDISAWRQHQLNKLREQQVTFDKRMGILFSQCDCIACYEYRTCRRTMATGRSCGLCQTMVCVDTGILCKDRT